VHVTFGAGSGAALPKLQAQGRLVVRRILDAATTTRMPGKPDDRRRQRHQRSAVLEGTSAVEIDDSLEAYDRVFSLSGVGRDRIAVGTYDVTFQPAASSGRSRRSGSR